jgi:hypothetical protein
MSGHLCAVVHIIALSIETESEGRPAMVHSRISTAFPSVETSEYLSEISNRLSLQV